MTALLSAFLQAFRRGLLAARGTELRNRRCRFRPVAGQTLHASQDRRPAQKSSPTKPMCTYSVNDNNHNNVYNWAVPAGAVIASGQGTASITVNWGVGGEYFGKCSNACGTSARKNPECWHQARHQHYYSDVAELPIKQQQRASISKSRPDNSNNRFLYKATISVQDRSAGPEWKITAAKSSQPKRGHEQYPD